MPLDVLLSDGHGGLLSMGDAASALGSLDRYDMVVFCAKELQPQRELMLAEARPRARVVYAPLNDGDLTQSEASLATAAADKAAACYLAHKKVLITCMQGRNRSGLVAALAVHLITGSGGLGAARFIREQRTTGVAGPALANLSFVRFLTHVEPTKAQGIVLAR